MSYTNLNLRTQSCEVCGITKHSKNLVLCEGCQVVWYCSSEHQESHLITHERACEWIKDSRKILENRDASLQQWSGISVFSELDVIVAEIAKDPDSWDGLGVTGQFPFVDALTQISTIEAYETALFHCQRMNLFEPRAYLYYILYLGVILRLGREQECYNFLKLWEVNYKGHREDPFLVRKDADPFQMAASNDTKEADPFEMAASFIDTPEDLDLYPDFGQLVCFQLLNIRRLMDLQTLQVASESLPKYLPRELVDMTKARVVGPSLSSRRDILECEDYSERIELMWESIKKCHRITRLYSESVWSEFLLYGPTNSTAAMTLDIELARKFVRPLMEEIPIALDIIRHLERSHPPPQGL
ncbi:hypothetical protein F4818DRAFT_451187 [Hypoxylon cercidicola]|nr:hypothetical protein F4818DRAFT_451187 [Hypoxylon cercidicola]